MTRANFRDQKIQTVLFAMGIPIGKAGIDGDSGPDTNRALRLSSDRIYKELAGKMTAEQAISTLAQREIGTKAHIEKALLEKLQDPKFRQEALDKLSKIDPPTEDSIKATKVILEASGHKISRDSFTGLVNGKMNDDTRVALANTDNGKPTAQFMENTIALAVGLKPEQVAGLFPNAPLVGTSFAAASSGNPSVVTRGVQLDAQPTIVIPQRAPS